MKEILFAIARMKGGGAENVMSALANQMKKNGDDVTLMVTDQRSCDVVIGRLGETIPLLSLLEMTEKPTFKKRIKYAVVSVFNRISCGISEKLGHRVGAKSAYNSFMWQQYTKIEALRKYLLLHPNASVVAFLQPTIPLVLLAANGLTNRIIISERADSKRLLGSRYGYNFVDKYYMRADIIVFQSPDAMKAYPEKLQAKGKVIFNPVKSELPSVYTGERRKCIVNFCRIAYQKNLALLIEAFASFYEKFPEYTLEIIGDAYSEKEEKLKADLIQLANDLNIGKSVKILPFTSNVHEYVNDCAMFVSSSDYEGMSNSMLEAMALGLPVICTDCPAGGARAVIENGKNGLLVPVGDKDALSRAMVKLASDKEYSDELSHNGALLKEKLDIMSISEEWSKCINGNDG